MEELEHASRLLALDEEAQEEFQKAVNKLAALCVCSVEQIADAFIALRNTLAETVALDLQTLSEQFNSLFNTEELFFMVPPHIKCLAYNHPKARVRNKNWNRMWKIRERYMKWHNQ